MTTVFPASVDSLPRPGAATYMDDTGFEGDLVIDNISDAVEAVEGYLLNGTAFKRIAEVGPLGSAQASLDFTSIPATFRSLMVVVQGRGSNASASVTVRVRFNNDSGANYDNEVLYATGTTPAALEEFAQTSAHVGYLPGSSAVANAAGQTEIIVANYVLTTFHKTARGSAALKTNTTTGTLFTAHFSGFWRSTAAINRVTLICNIGNFDVGTIATLYGLPT